MNTNNKKIIIRQGDILFKTSAKNLNKEQPVGHKTVALGEITGHHHSFGGNDQVLLFQNEQTITGLEVVEKENQLTHQEHLGIQFPTGEYEVSQERSFNPFLRNIHRSVD